MGGGTATQAKTIRSCEFDRHAPVLSALFLDLGDRQLPDLGCARDMGAAARLQIDLPCPVTNPHKANTPRPAWRLHRHGFDKTGLGVKFGLGDPFLAHNQIARDQRIQPPLEDRALIGIGHLGHVEIKPPLVMGDGTTRHRKRQHHLKKMQRCMDAHMAIAALPIEALLDLGP